jgi:3'-phosphoadenosine 5'-phosphosulfate sulfotransferase (PAPS reductase)/FAD synthetase
LQSDLYNATQYVKQNFNLVVVSYSAGRDSTAALEFCAEHFDNVIAWMSDTGIEPPESEEYAQRVTAAAGVPFEMCRSVVEFQDGSKVWDAYSALLRSGKWPIPNRCYFSSVLKRERARRWIVGLEGVKPIWVMGHRRAESPKRAKLPYLDKRKQRLSWCGAPLFYPVLDYTDADVAASLRRLGVEPHPAYAAGRRRVGCVACVCSNIQDIELDVKLYPEIVRDLCEVEAEIGHRWKKEYPLWRFVYPELWSEAVEYAGNKTKANEITLTRARALFSVGARRGT